jgi:hypothetical protein
MSQIFGAVKKLYCLSLVPQQIRWFWFGAVIRWWFSFGDVGKSLLCWCCSQISQIFGAVKKLYCLSLVLPFCLVLQLNKSNIWCCQRIILFEFGVLNELYNLFLLLSLNYLIQ